VPPPTLDDLRKGVLPFILPLPRWEISQPGDYFRSFERAAAFRALILRRSHSISWMNRAADNKLSDRGLGTQLLISSPVLNIRNAA